MEEFRDCVDGKSFRDVQTELFRSPIYVEKKWLSCQDYRIASVHILLHISLFI